MWKEMNGPKFQSSIRRHLWKQHEERDKLNLLWWSEDISDNINIIDEWSLDYACLLTYMRALPWGQRIETETQCSTFFLNKKNSQKYFSTDWLSDFGMFTGMIHKKLLFDG